MARVCALLALGAIMPARPAVVYWPPLWCKHRSLLLYQCGNAEYGGIKRAFLGLLAFMLLVARPVDVVLPAVGCTLAPASVRLATCCLTMDYAGSRAVVGASFVPHSGKVVAYLDGALWSFGGTRRAGLSSLGAVVGRADVRGLM